MIDTYRKIRDLLDARERRRALLLFGLMLVMGVMETIGVGSVVPFISVVANPEVVANNFYLAAVYDALGFSNTNAFLVFLGVVVFLLMVASQTCKALTHWAIARYAQMRTFTLSTRLLRGYLARPYNFFLNRHSADLGKSVLSEVSQVINRALMPALNLVANIIVASFIITLVVMIDPLVAAVGVVVLGGIYTLIYVMLRRYISHSGAKRVKANKERFQIAQEALGGIKDVKILGLEDGYIKSFQKPAMRFARVQANNQIIGQMPQYFLQALMYGGMLVLLIGLLVSRKGALDEVLPIVGLYAIAGNRLMPAFQQIYKSMTALRFGRPALDALHKDLVENEQTDASVKIKKSREPLQPLRLNEVLKLERVRYTYPQAQNPALVDLSLTVPANTTVGFVGGSGAGKTTAVDVILGLLEPQHGKLMVDNQEINGNNLRAWQRSIGYVPQAIFLTDDTVSANIAFGASKEDIDQKQVERAARIAELHEFVINEMSDGYSTMIGERGVRMSGGQRQRIGIARALYHNPDVLVLDEATSSLDNVTEKAVMDAIHNLSHRKTIIIIAHRLSTVRECDEIFMLERGRLIAQGNYEQLFENSHKFNAMAGSIS